MSQYAGSPQAEFRMAGGVRGRAMAPMMAPVLVLAVVLLLLGSIFGPLVGIVVSVLGAAVAAGFLWMKVNQVVGANTLRFDPSGIRWDSGGGVIHTVSWSDLTGIGPVNVQLTPQRRVHVAGIPRTTQVSMSDHGLHGWSSVTLPPRVPAILRQARSQLPYDPSTGKHHIGIPLASFDPQWPQGPIASWIHAYRPDLLHEPPTDAGEEVG